MVKKIILFSSIFTVLLLSGVIIAFKYMQLNRATSNKPFTPRLVSNTVPPNSLSSWLGYWDEDSAINSLTNYGDKIKSISPMWYQLNTTGEVEKITQAQKIDVIKETAQNKNILILPTITNEFDADKVSTFLNSQEYQDKSVEFLVNEAQKNGYKGWDIDFEELYEGDKNGYSDYIKQLADALHSNNLKLSVTLQAKTNLSTDRAALKAQDWPALSQSSDYIRIMAYDFHDSESESGAITPIEDMDNVLKYAVTVIPLDKLVLGLPLYGYDWVGTKGSDVQFSEANKILSDNKGSIIRDPASKELIGTYSLKGISHTIWYQDSESTQAKINVARSHGIYQFIFWRLGGEDKATWNN